MNFLKVCWCVNQYFVVKTHERPFLQAMKTDLISFDSDIALASRTPSSGVGTSFMAPQTEAWTAASTRRIKSAARVWPSRWESVAIRRSEKNAKHELDTMRSYNPKSRAEIEIPCNSPSCLCICHA